MEPQESKRASWNRSKLQDDTLCCRGCSDNGWYMRATDIEAKIGAQPEVRLVVDGLDHVIREELRVSPHHRPVRHLCNWSNGVLGDGNPQM